MTAPSRLCPGALHQGAEVVQGPSCGALSRIFTLGRLLTSRTQAKDAHVGVVKSFSAPSTPKPPTLPADLASELSAYDAAEPTRADSKAASTSTEQVGAGAEEFLAFLEADEPKAADAHH